MATVPMLNLPPLRNEDEFECFVRDLLSSVWDDPNIVRNGRRGQRQNGVDLYGDRGDSDIMAGVQCKAHSSIPISIREIEQEITKAEEFEPPLTEYLIVTTSTRDGTIQSKVRGISQQRTKAGLFPVRIWFWEDALERLAISPHVIRAYYPDIFHPTVETESLELTLHNDDRTQFFLSSRIHKELDHLRRETVRTLENSGWIRVWHWERDKVAAMDPYHDVCLNRIGVSQCLVLIVGRDISSFVIGEYQEAVRNRLPVLAYAADVEDRTEDAIAFIEIVREKSSVLSFKNESEFRTGIWQSAIRIAQSGFERAKYKTFHTTSVPSSSGRMSDHG